MPTVGSVDVLKEESLLIEKVHLFSKFVAISKDICPTHNNLTTCNVYLYTSHTCWCGPPVNDSYQHGALLELFSQ